MGVSRHIKPFETIKRLTHNQVVPGSSPGGTTSLYTGPPRASGALFLTPFLASTLTLP